MKKLLITIAATALIGVPLAAQAQDRDGRHDGRDGYARSAAGHGHDAVARVYGDRRGGARYGHVEPGRFDRDGAVRNRSDRDRFASDRFAGDRGRFRGGIAVGFGYGGAYPYGGGYYGGDGNYGGAGYYGSGGYDGGSGYAGGGYYDAGPGYDDSSDPSGDDGGGYTYSYPDQQGTYEPFDYAYSNRDDAYYANGGPADASEAYDRSGAAPNVGWSAGGAPVDCGQWVWRESRGAYQWVAAPCRYPQ